MTDKEIQSMQVQNIIMSKALTDILDAATWDESRKIAYQTLGAFKRGFSGTYGWDSPTAADIVNRQKREDDDNGG